MHKYDLSIDKLLHIPIMYCSNFMFGKQFYKVKQLAITFPIVVFANKLPNL